MPKKRTHSEYIELLERKNIGHRPLETYINKRTKILHICSNNYHKWFTTPDSIIQGYGCPHCNNISQTKTHKQYEKEIMLLDSPVFPIGKYINKSTPILHECWSGHQWKTAPSHILSGGGCPSCAQSSFDPNKEATLYFVRVLYDDITYYKVGITNTTPEQRHFKDWKNLQLSLEWSISFSKGRHAKEAEKIILDAYNRFNASSIVPFMGGGSTEVLTIEVLLEEAFILVGHLLDPEKLSIYVASPIKT